MLGPPSAGTGTFAVRSTRHQIIPPNFTQNFLSPGDGYG
jgi:hypothetical protein